MEKLTSNAKEADCPQIPPIAIPNKALAAKNCWKLVVNPDPRDKAEQQSKLKIKGHFLPNLSLANPKMMAPNGLNSKVKVIDVVTVAVVTPKSTTNLETLRDTAKKSTASQSHENHPLRKKSTCKVVSDFIKTKGFAEIPSFLGILGRLATKIKIKKKVETQGLFLSVYDQSIFSGE